MDSRRLAPWVGLALFAFSPAAALADPGDDIGTAVIQVNVCHRTAGAINQWVLVPVDLQDLPARVAQGDVPFMASVDECFQQAPRSLFLVPQDAGMAKEPPLSDPSAQPEAIPEKDPKRRAIPVEMAPLEPLPAGGGQGSLPGDGVWRDARPVEVERLPEAPTGGGQGQVPDESAWRDGRPVSAELFEDVAAMGPDGWSLSASGVWEGDKSGNPEEAHTPEFRAMGSYRWRYRRQAKAACRPPPSRGRSNHYACGTAAPGCDRAPARLPLLRVPRF